MKPGIHGLPRRSAAIARSRRRRRIAAASLALALFGFLAWVGYEIWPQRSEVIGTVASALSTPARRVEPSSHPGRLAPAETLLTDGTPGLPAPGGNLVSGHAQPPLAGDEPPAALPDETETGDSSMAGARTDPRGAAQVPFMQAWSGTYAGDIAPSGADPAPGMFASVPHVWPNDGGSLESAGSGGSYASSAGSHAAVLGGGERGSDPDTKDEVQFLPPGVAPGDHGAPSGGTPFTSGGTPFTTGETTGVTSGSTSGGTTGSTGETTGVTTGTTTGTTTGATIGTTTGTTTATTSDETTGGTTTGITTGITAGDTTGNGPGDTEIPEPATLLLLGLGAGGVVVRAWRSRR